MPATADMTHGKAAQPLSFQLKVAACPYLQQRGISADTAAHFGAGLCQRGHFNDCAVFPIRHYPAVSPDECPVSYVGRWPGPDNESGKPQPPRTVTARKPGHSPSRLPQDRLIAWCELCMTIEGRASSDDTVDAKRRDSQTFVPFFLSAAGVDRVDLWTRSITTDYLKYLERQLKRKPATINRHLATLKHVARWIASQRPFLAGNPTDGIADLEPDDPEWRGLTAIQVTRLKAAADQLLHLQRKQNESPYRNFALFTVLLQTGLRISELLALRLEQYEGKHFTNVKRKGKKRSRKVFLNRPAREALEKDGYR